MQINLLPWREHERRRKKIRFSSSLVTTVILALIAIIILHIFYRGLITHQKHRNQYLQSIIDHEQLSITKINEQKKQLSLIKDELKFIINLKENSYDAVRILDELSKVVPEGVSFMSIVRENQNIVIIGRSKSDLQVTQFMENLTKSKIFQQPVLTTISSIKTSEGEERLFQINVAEEGIAP